MLFIVDACFGSNIIKGQQQDDGRVYKLLCASGIDKPTEGPGPRSFTTVMISALEMLLKDCGEKPFTTQQLCEIISIRPERQSHGSCVWHYNHRYHRCIEWAPLKHTLDERKKAFSHGETRAHLSLCVCLTEGCLNETQITELCKAFCTAAKKVKAPVRRIDCRGLRGFQGAENFAKAGKDLAAAVKYVKRWQSQASTKPRDQMMQKTDDPDPQAMNESSASESAVLEATSELATPPQSSRKRRTSGRQSESSGPRAKRRVPEDAKQREHTTPSPHPLTPFSGEELDES